MSIDWDSISYSSSQANEDFENLVIESNGVRGPKIQKEWEELQKKLNDAYHEVYDLLGYDETGKNPDYEFDLEYGLAAYKILCNEIGFTNRVACSDDVWRYLSVCVIPNITHRRFGKNADHFYAKPNRIWIKTIWWYIHLGWAGSTKETRERLKGNTTDVILQLVERPGLGYYTEVYREILRRFAKLKQSNTVKTEILRSVMVLNTARLMTTSPELVDNGIKGYVGELFKIAGNKK